MANNSFLINFCQLICCLFACFEEAVLLIGGDHSISITLVYGIIVSLGQKLSSWKRKKPLRLWHYCLAEFIRQFQKNFNAFIRLTLHGLTTPSDHSSLLLKLQRSQIYQPFQNMWLLLIIFHPLRWMHSLMKCLLNSKTVTLLFRVTLICLHIWVEVGKAYNTSFCLTYCHL